jgi:hypothetical protein
MPVFRWLFTLEETFRLFMTTCLGDEVTLQETASLG